MPRAAVLLFWTRESFRRWIWFKKWVWKDISIFPSETYTSTTKNNFKNQRLSYNIHKGILLIKPMVIVTTTVCFVLIQEQHLADHKNNYASIIKHIMKTDAEHIKSCLSEHDMFIVDRWFSDALPMLKDLGIQAEILRCLEKGQKQMSIGDTNKSRPVTKVRNLKKKWYQSIMLFIQLLTTVLSLILSFNRSYGYLSNPMPESKGGEICTEPYLQYRFLSSEIMWEYYWWR